MTTVGKGLAPGYYPPAAMQVVAGMPRRRLATRGRASQVGRHDVPRMAHTPGAQAMNAEAMTAGRLIHRLSMQWAMMLTVLVPLRQRSQPNRKAVMR